MFVYRFLCFIQKNFLAVFVYRWLLVIGYRRLLVILYMLVITMLLSTQFALLSFGLMATEVKRGKKWNCCAKLLARICNARRATYKWMNEGKRARNWIHQEMLMLHATSTIGRWQQQYNPFVRRQTIALHCLSSRERIR